MDHLRCVVERITYQNAQNGYSVIKCRVKGYSGLVTVVGSMPNVHVGPVLELGGSPGLYCSERNGYKAKYHAEGKAAESTGGIFRGEGI